MDRQESPIFVTRSTLPPLETFVEYLQEIWKTRQLTNFGPFAKELERRLGDFVQSAHPLYVTNGTLALQLAIKALDLKGEIITTPFSFVATSSAIKWEGCTPVLVDVDRRTFNIDPAEVEKAITPNTSAILATHVYGNPCDIEALEQICKRHNLKLIFDGAHCFGIKYRGKSLLSYGDMTILSLHATKVFHSVEGGMIFTQDAELARRVDYMRNYGFKGAEAFQGLGINAKCSELHAAMGLALWPQIEETITKRLQVQGVYDRVLGRANGIRKQQWHSEASENGAYYPVVFQTEEILKEVIKALNDRNVFPRRYFYPCLSSLEYSVSKGVPLAEDLSKRVLCLPVYPDLNLEVARNIAEVAIAASSAHAVHSEVPLNFPSPQ